MRDPCWSQSSPGSNSSMPKGSCTTFDSEFAIAFKVFLPKPLLLPGPFNFPRVRISRLRFTTSWSIFLWTYMNPGNFCTLSYDTVPFEIWWKAYFSIGPGPSTHFDKGHTLATIMDGFPNSSLPIKEKLLFTSSPAPNSTDLILLHLHSVLTLFLDVITFPWYIHRIWVSLTEPRLISTTWAA